MRQKLLGIAVCILWGISCSVCAVGAEPSATKLYVQGMLADTETPLLVENGVTWIEIEDFAKEVDKEVIVQEDGITIGNTEPKIGTKSLFYPTGQKGSVSDGITVSLSPLKQWKGNWYAPLREVFSALEYTVSYETVSPTDHRIYAQAVPVEVTETDQSFAFACMSLFLQEETAVMSPISGKMILAMTANGAVGATQQEVLHALGYSSLEDANTAMETVRETVSIGGEQEKVGYLHIANSIWSNNNAREIQWKTPFVEVVKTVYGGSVHAVSERTMLPAIHQWLAEETRGQVTELFPEGTVLQDVLLNTIAMEARWQREFDPEKTKDALFYHKDGTTTTVPMMEQTISARYIEDGVLKMVLLPYQECDIEMAILLGDGTIDESTWHRMIRYADVTNVSLFLPKFEVESQYTMAQSLQQLGIKTMFSEQGDFSNMITGDTIAVKEILQKVKLSVDETGTKAAAVTAVIRDKGGVSARETEFRADHPFRYVIFDTKTGELLFVGQYV